MIIFGLVIFVRGLFVIITIRGVFRSRASTTVFFISIYLFARSLLTTVRFGGDGLVERALCETPGAV